MNFRARILVALLLAGVLPVALLGAMSYRANREQLRQTTEQLQREAAGELARSCSAVVLGGVESLQLAVGYLPLAQLNPVDLEPALRIPFRQLAAVTLLALVDARGDAVAPAVFSERSVDGKPAVDAEGRAAFSSHVPLRDALAAGAAVGEPYRAAGGEAARIAVAVRIDAQPVRLLVAELSLLEVERRLNDIGLRGGLAVIVDGRGRLVAQSSAGEVLGPEELRFAAEASTAAAPRVRELRRADGGRFLAAFAPVPELGWGVIVGRPVSEALAPAEAVRRYTIFWVAVALLLTGALGLLLSHDVVRPIAALSEATQRIGDGHYDSQVPVRSRDELGQLAESFNRMAREIQRRDDEIRAWNEQLQVRVDEKTRQLQQAQDQVERARRLAAIASLSAGFAHELNTPLTGILGLGAILRGELKGSPEGQQMLEQMLGQARRMARVVRELQQLSERERQGRGVRFSPLRPVRAALDEVRGRLAERGIELSCDFAGRLPDVEGDPEQLKQVVGHLLQNAITAMPRGGALTVGVDAVGCDAVRLCVRDTGKGIAPALRERIFDPFFTTKDEPGHEGLGLSVCNQVVSAHHGRIDVESVPERGSTFTVVLPAAGAEAHLT